MGAAAVGSALGQKKIGGHLIRVGARLDGGIQHPPQPLVKLLQLVLIQIPDGGFRMDARLKKNLIGVDVADSRDTLLIHEPGFDATPTFRRPFEKCVFGDG